MFTFQDVSKINYADRCKAYNVYKNVLVLLDEDYDSRIYDFVDSLGITSQSLCAVMENEGCLYLLWYDLIPHNLTEDKDVKVFDDIWNIRKSILINENSLEG